MTETNKLEPLAANLMYDALKNLSRARDVLREARSKAPPKDFNDDSPVQEIAGAMKGMLGGLGDPLDPQLARMIHDLAVLLVSMDGAELLLDDVRIPLPKDPARGFVPRGDFPGAAVPTQDG
jgi:hypothetical protein